MNREQLIEDLVADGINEVRKMEVHQWLGVIRTLLNLVLNSMDDKDLIEEYLQRLERDNERENERFKPIEL